MGQFDGVKTMTPPYGYQLIIKLISNNVMHAVDIMIISVYNLRVIILLLSCIGWL